MKYLLIGLVAIGLVAIGVAGSLIMFQPVDWWRWVYYPACLVGGISLGIWLGKVAKKTTSVSTNVGDDE